MTRHSTPPAKITIKKDTAIRPVWSVYRGRVYLASYQTEEAAKIRQNIELEKCT